MKKIIALILFITTAAVANYDAKPLPVVKGGSGDASLNAYGVLFGGTTSTGPIQSLSSTGTSGQVLTSGGASALPSWATPTVYANQALSNLSGVAINSSLLPASAGSANIGSAALPFGTDFEQMIELMGSSSGNVQIKAPSAPTSWTITLPAAVCSSGQYWADNGSGVYTCTSPSSSGANTALSNLSAVAINTSLLPASAGSASIGSAALPFATDFEQSLELIGSTSGHFILQAASTTTSWTATAPAAVCASGQYWADNGSGVYSCTSPSAIGPTVANGGDTAYSIPGVNYHVRTGTTLTAGRTYTLPACSGGNIASSTSTGKVEVKNLASQTFNITLVPNGSDTIDGGSSHDDLSRRFFSASLLRKRCLGY